MSARPASAAKQRPRTGDKREVRQPLKIDKLPEDLHKEILKLRSKEGLTWLAIEERSPRLEGWKSASAAQLAIFPGLRIPHSNLQRCYDLRVEQVQRQVLADSAKARELAAAFAAREFKALPEAVMNALRDQIFSLMQVGENNSGRSIAALLAFGELVSQFKKNEIKQQLVDIETKRTKILQDEAERKRIRFESETNKAAKKLGKGKAVTLGDINNIRERVFGLPPLAAAANHPA